MKLPKLDLKRLSEPVSTSSSTLDLHARKELARQQFLADLRVLDTPPEAFTDAVVTAAAAIANVPSAMITLVDRHRQWFKGAWGMELTETSRDISFCSHTILEATPLVVEDALLDARFRDNPMVTGSTGIRFYAGFPLIVEGHGLGALCVIDDHPRRLTSEQFGRLGTLAAGTATWLARRLRNQAA